MDYGNDIRTVTTALVLLALGFIGWMGRGWIRHVNDSIKAVNTTLGKLFDLLRDLNKDREERWIDQGKQCTKHGERISFLEAKINGKKGV